MAIVDVPTTGSIATNYIREDHQGSTECVIASNGASVVKESFTAFGARRNSCTWDGPPTNGMLTRINSVTRRGYTWQNALGAMGLNDMNGRIEDAVTGRFLSADPYVPDPGNPQSFNRYSYALNNPLTYTDPSGFAQLPPPGTGNPEAPPPPLPCDFAPSCPGGIPTFPDFPSFPSIPGWDGVNGGCQLGHPALCQAYIDLLNWLRDHPPPAPPTPPTPNPGYVKGPPVTPVAKGPLTRAWQWFTKTRGVYDEIPMFMSTGPYGVMPLMQDGKPVYIQRPISYATITATALEAAGKVAAIGGLARIGSAPAVIDAAAARAGATIFKTAHYAPRLEAAGVNVARAEAAVADAVNAMRPNMATGADVAGRLQIDKVLLEYRARLLPDGSVNVGTIFPVKP